MSLKKTLAGAVLTALLTVTGANAVTQGQDACTPQDYAHVPHPDDFTFECVGSTLEVRDAVTGE